MGVSDGQSLAEIQLIQLYGCYSQACRHHKEPGAASLLTMETHSSYSAVPTAWAPGDSNQRLLTLRAGSQRSLVGSEP